MPKTKLNLLQRFSKFVNLKNTEECWLWTGAKSGWGHGQIKLNGRMDGAHRISFILFKGEIPLGKSVLHSCDIPLCVNPRHLRVGTQSDNLRDAFERGRRRPMRVREYKYKNEILSMAEIARRENICPASLRYQLVVRNKSIADAIKHIRGEP